jgi:hypothetical protein
MIYRADLVSEVVDEVVPLRATAAAVRANSNLLLKSDDTKPFSARVTKISTSNVDITNGPGHNYQNEQRNYRSVLLMNKTNGDVSDPYQTTNCHFDALPPPLCLPFMWGQTRCSGPITSFQPDYDSQKHYSYNALNSIHES